jgi:hypothetical protein
MASAQHEQLHHPDGPGRPTGIVGLAVLFCLAALASVIAAFSLSIPDSAFDAMWAADPPVRLTFVHMGIWGVALAACLALAFVLSAIGLWHGTRWGRLLALVLLIESGLAATVHAVADGHPIAIIGQVIVGLLIAYLLFSAPVRTFFSMDR